ncbi:MAG: HmuY family protein [Saprospiraceae bacterium]
MKLFTLFILIIFCSLIYSCTDDNPSTTPGISTTINNLPADPTTGYDPVTGAPIGDKKLFTFLKLADSSIIPNSDSATNRWDIGFKATTIIINSGTSGPGQAGAFIFNGIFKDLKSVPKDSFFKTDNFPLYAIGKSWSLYDNSAMIVRAVPGKVIVLRTADGKYAKMEILSYYKNAPANPNAFVDQARYYTLRYVYQADGSKNFD